MKKYLFIFLAILFISIVSAQQLNYNNPNLPKILPNQPRTITATSNGANVTSVTSGNGCIAVSPTTGNVVITFNTSCGGDGSFNSTYAMFAYNQTSPVFLQPLLNNTIGDYGRRVGFNDTFNQSYHNFAYNQTLAVFVLSLFNNTIANYGVRVGFNSTSNPFNQVLNTSSNVTFNNITVTQEINIGASRVSIWLYNQTTAAFLMSLLNNTIADYGLRIGFNSTFNTTYDNSIGQHCASGQFHNGTLSNGTLSCSTPTATASNPFDQVLNKSSGVIHDSLNTTRIKIDQGGLGEWIKFNFATIPLGSITSELGIFEFHALSNFNFYFTNTARSVIIQLLDTGYLFLQGTGIKLGDTGSNPYMETNATRTTIYTNTSMKSGYYHDWALNNSIINAAGVNITSNHQNYNLSIGADVVFGMVYINNFSRPILLQASAEATTTLLGTDIASFIIYADDSSMNLTAKTGNICSVSDAKLNMVQGCQANTVIQPNAKWQINSTTSGGGSIILKQVWVTVI